MESSLHVKIAQIAFRSSHVKRFPLNCRLENTVWLVLSHLLLELKGLLDYLPLLANLLILYRKHVDVEISRRSLSLEINSGLLVIEPRLSLTEGIVL